MVVGDYRLLLLCVDHGKLVQIVRLNSDKVIFSWYVRGLGDLECEAEI